jgi:hypothetical protein
MLVGKWGCCYRGLVEICGETPSDRDALPRVDPWSTQGEQERLCYLLHAVVGGFASDDYVVDVGFAEAGAGDAHEAAVGFQVG